MQSTISTVLLMLAFFSSACKDYPGTTGDQFGATNTDTSAVKNLKFACAISNGMKGDSLFFEVSPDRKKLSDLYFKGYWRCAGKLTQERAAGPEGSFTIANNKIDGVVSEPPGGGSTAWRFEMHAVLDGKKVSGTFRMNINALGCDSYVLKFAGVAR